MPTDDNVNASEQTVTTPPVSPEITEDAIKAHPLYQELETKHAAARKGLDEKAVEVKKLKTALLGEDQKEERQEEPQPIKKEDLEKLKWELKHENEIQLANKNGLYDKLISEGKSVQDALDLALYREGLSSTQASKESMRQASVSAPSQGIDRSSDTDIDGLPKAYVEKLKAMKLPESQIREIVKNAKARAAKRG